MHTQIVIQQSAFPRHFQASQMGDRSRELEALNACVRGNLQALQKLLEADAQLLESLLRFGPPYRAGRPPLMLAVANGHTHVVRPSITVVVCSLIRFMRKADVALPQVK